MLVKQLIDQLQTLDPNLHVLMEAPDDYYPIEFVTGDEIDRKEVVILTCWEIYNSDTCVKNTNK